MLPSPAILHLPEPFPFLLYAVVAPHGGTDAHVAMEKGNVNSLVAAYGAGCWLTTALPPSLFLVAFFALSAIHMRKDIPGGLLGSVTAHIALAAWMHVDTLSAFCAILAFLAAVHTPRHYSRVGSKCVAVPAALTAVGVAAAVVPQAAEVDVENGLALAVVCGHILYNDVALPALEA